MRKTVMWLAGAALAAVFLVPGRASAWHPHYRAAVASGYYAQGQAVSAQGLGQFLPLINWGLQGLQLLDQGGTPIHLNLQPNPTPTPPQITIDKATMDQLDNSLTRLNTLKKALPSPPPE